jgi:hypothetical protein
MFAINATPAILNSLMIYIRAQSSPVELSNKHFSDPFRNSLPYSIRDLCDIDRRRNSLRNFLSTTLPDLDLDFIARAILILDLL